MAPIFCSATRRQSLERKQATITAVLATLGQTSKSESKLASPEEYFAVFEQHYTGDASQLPKRRLGKALRMLSESKRRDEFQRKLEKKNSSLERKLSTSSTATTAATSTKSSAASSTTLVDSSDDEKERKTSSDSEGAPLELTWTWSAMGEAF
jgi:hypothetical protein